MRDEIDSLINDEFGKVTGSIEDFYDETVREDIKNRVNFTNLNKQKEDYRQELLRELKRLCEINKNIIYDESLPLDELEKIVDDVHAGKL